MVNKKISFEVKIGKFEKINSLFSKAYCRVGYANLNRNNSFIAKEVYEAALPSLYYAPVVGEWLEKNDNFGGHGGKLEITGKEIKWIDTTIPYGCVGANEDINFRWELGDDGREYFTVDIYLWTHKFPELQKVIEDSSWQSMEITVNDGEFQKIDEQDVYVIKDMTFNALCILGKSDNPDINVEPCFEDSKIVAYSLDKDSFKNEFNQMVHELKYSLSNSTTSYKEWCNSNVNIKVNNSKEQIINEVLDISNSDITSDELLIKNFEKEEDEIMLFNKEEFAQTFKLTAMQLYDVLWSELCKVTYIETWYDEAYETCMFWMRDYDDQFVYAYNCDKGIDVKIPYTMEGDNPVLDFENAKRIKYTPVDWEDSMGEEIETEFSKSVETSKKDFAEKIYACGSSKMAIEKDTSFAVEKEAFETEKKEFEIKLSEKDNEVKDFELKYNELDIKLNESETKYSEVFSKLESMSDYEELKSYKVDKTVSEKEAMFSQFSTKLSEDEMKSIKDKSSELSVDEIKDKLFALVGQKNFSLNSNSIITMGIGGFEEKEVISTDKPYSDIINKHVKNKNSKQ